MDIPANFEKINDEKFSINGKEFRIALDFMNAGHIWVFRNENDERFEYCLYFIFDWKSYSYRIRRCKTGLGTTGDDIVGTTNFTKKKF